MREYCRKHIEGAWHYPDDREPCPYCGSTATRAQHRPDLGIRGYLGPGPVAIVSLWPSCDEHFKLDQAKNYYEILKKHGLENAFQADVLNASLEKHNATMNFDEQKALFQVQLEVVQPRVMLVMDSHSYPRRSGRGWAGMGPLRDVARHLEGDGFELKVHPEYRPNRPPYLAMTVKCKPPEISEFAFDVYTIYHYTNLSSNRFATSAEEPQAKWERRLSAVLSSIRQ